MDAIAKLSSKLESAEANVRTMNEMNQHLNNQLSSATRALIEKNQIIERLEHPNGDEEHGAADEERAEGDTSLSGTANSANNTATNNSVNATLSPSASVAALVTPTLSTSPVAASANASVQALQKQLHALSSQMATYQLNIEEKENTIISLNTLIKSLKSRINNELLVEAERLNHKIREQEKQLAAGGLLKLEQDSLISNLRKELKSKLEQLEESERKQKTLQEKAQTLSDRNNEFNNLADKLSAYEIQLNEKNALVTRLRSEIATNERNYALKTTVLASYEVKLNELKDEIVQLKKQNELVGNDCLLLKMRFIYVCIDNGQVD